MINFDTVPVDVYHDTPGVLSAIEVLNSHGYSGILGATEKVRLDELSIPLEVVNPLSSPVDEPFGNFDEGFVLNVYGAANGHRNDGTRVMNALIAEVTGMPVVGVPLPDRDWHGPAIPNSTRGWIRLSQEQRRRRGMQQLDAFADHVIESVDTFVDREKGVGKLFVFGGSAGSAIGLSVAYRARRFDRGNVSVMALPNVEERALYRDLFTDFLSSRDGMPEMITDGPVALRPLVEMSGIDRKSKSITVETMRNLGYLTKDMFGLWPIDPRLELFRMNTSLARPLTVPTALEQIERLGNSGNGIVINAGLLELDAVARHTELARLGANRCTPGNARFKLFEGVGHTACNNPYIVGYMASLLTEK